MADDLKDLILTAFDPANPQSQHASELILSLISQEPISVLSHVLTIAFNESELLNLRCRAIIIGKKCFPYPSASDPPSMAQYPSELISECLDGLFPLFGSQNETLRSLSADFFSRITRLCLLIGEGEDILERLISCLSNPSSESYIVAVCIVLCDVFENCEVSSGYVGKVLEEVFNIVSNSLLTTATKRSCLLIVRSLISNMADLLSEDSTSEALLSIIGDLCSYAETSSGAYFCLSDIADLFYPVLDHAPPQIFQLSLDILNGPLQNREPLLGVCTFWQSVAACECDKHAALHIVESQGENLIRLLIRVASSSPETFCTPDEAHEPHIVASIALNSVVKCCGAKFFDSLCSYANSYATSASYGERETALAIISYLIDDFDVSQHLDEFLQIISNGMKDSCPRVQENALTCIHRILIDILDRGDDSLLASQIGKLGAPLLQMSERTMEYVREVSDVSGVASFVAADFLRFPGYPYVQEGLEALFDCAVKSANSGDVSTSRDSFSALSNALSHIPSSVLEVMLESCSRLLEQAIASQGSDWLLDSLSFLLHGVLVRLPEDLCIDAKKLWQLLTETYSSHPELGSKLLTVMCSLGRANRSVFELYSDFLFDTLYNALSSDAFAVSGAASGLSLLCSTPSIEKYSSKFCGALCGCIKKVELPYLSRSYCAQALSDIIRTYPSLACEEAVDSIIACSSGLGDYLDSIKTDDTEDDEVDNFEFVVQSFLSVHRSMSKVLMNLQSSLIEKLTDNYLDLMELVGGLSEHGRDLIEEFIMSLHFLIVAFPSTMKPIFYDEPGFQYLLRGACETSICPEEVHALLSMLS